jgi:hypothetical protein
MPKNTLSQDQYAGASLASMDRFRMNGMLVTKGVNAVPSDSDPATKFPTEF